MSPPNGVLPTTKTAKKIRKKASTTRPSNRHLPKTGPNAAMKTVSKPQSTASPTANSTNLETNPSKSAFDRCIAGGPNGPPVYDELGFLLSYQKCCRAWGRPRRSLGAKYFAMLDQKAAESECKREIMGTAREKVSALTYMAWDDRVARELGIMYHQVEMKHFEILAQRGFVGKEGEFEASNMSEEERERLTVLAAGSAFRA